MTLLSKIDALWGEAQQKQTSKWAKDIKKRRHRLESAIDRFREWSPLYVYISVAEAKGYGKELTFSLRYAGDAVANLNVSEKGIHIEQTGDTRSNAIKYGYSCSKNSFPWDSTDGSALRKYFKDKGNSIDVNSAECAIESEFLTQMLREDSGKFNGSLSGIQPVLLGDCRFQMPVPLSANTGTPEQTKGNVDILARRSGKRLSIWELKKVNESNHHAIEQAYIYAVQILKMLRANDESASIWYRDIFGYNTDVPNRLIIESVVAVSFNNEKDKGVCLEKYRKFKAENALKIGNDEIELHLAFYKIDPLNKLSPLSLELFEV